MLPFLVADRAGPDQWGAFGRLTAAVIIRSAAFFSITAFLPLWWVADLHHSKAAGLFTVLVVSACLPLAAAALTLTLPAPSPASQPACPASQPPHPCQVIGADRLSHALAHGRVLEIALQRADQHDHRRPDRPPDARPGGLVERQPVAERTPHVAARRRTSPGVAGKESPRDQRSTATIK